MPIDQEHQQNRNASPIASTDEEDAGTGGQHRPVKKRKATYLVTKEEKARLSREVQGLEATLSVLKERVGLTGDRSLEKVATSNVVLGSVLRQQQLLVANAQAGLAACMRGPAPNPLYSYIHLGADHDTRRRVLDSIRDFKIQNGIDYIEARSRHLDLLEPYTSSEQFVDTKGDFCSSFFDVTQFAGVRSVREVYDAAMFHFMNEEISISERLGFITVREDFNIASDNFGNCRLSSADEHGVKTEANTASFAKCVKAEEAKNGKPFGVLVRDNVDVDEIYPYNSDECVRKDYQGVILLTAVKRKNSNNTLRGQKEDEVIVIMRRAAYVKIHRPPFPLSARSQEGLHRGTMEWCDVMLTSMQSVLAANSSARGLSIYRRSRDDHPQFDEVDCAVLVFLYKIVPLFVHRFLALHLHRLQLHVMIIW